ncbi:MAG TPA: endonuclease III [Candidatus Nanoarchaeia archaeon]|nr:endonuclease III [Candidatus Nanoarchaeia archaeon]
MHNGKHHFKEIFAALHQAAASFRQPAVTEIAEADHDPFKVLISCILSLRTRDETTAPAALRLFRLADTPQRMARLPVRLIREAIYPVGFYITKAKRIKGICGALLGKYRGKVPRDFEQLMGLKGVGRKTANIVMVYGFHDEGLPIDTHCHRIPNRLGWVQTKTPEETEQRLRAILPKRYWHDFNDLFVQFGQNICTPISPFCSRCPIRKHCRRVGVAVSR